MGGAGGVGKVQLGGLQGFRPGITAEYVTGCGCAIREPTLARSQHVFGCVAESFPTQVSA